MLSGLSQKNEALICKFEPQTSSLKETGRGWQRKGRFPRDHFGSPASAPCGAGLSVLSTHFPASTNNPYLSFKSRSALLSWGRHGTCPGRGLPCPPQASPINAPGCCQSREALVHILCSLMTRLSCSCIVCTRGCTTRVETAGGKVFQKL